MGTAILFDFLFVKSFQFSRKMRKCEVPLSLFLVFNRYMTKDRKNIVPWRSLLCKNSVKFVYVLWKNHGKCMDN